MFVTLDRFYPFESDTCAKAGERAAGGSCKYCSVVLECSVSLVLARLNSTISVYGACVLKSSRM